MSCPERNRLLCQCAVTVHTFTRVSIKWQKLTESPVTDEYWDCRKAREEARIDVDLAYTELEQHERRHCCQPQI
jgi:hypothetical protein